MFFSYLEKNALLHTFFFPDLRLMRVVFLAKKNSTNIELISVLVVVKTQRHQIHYQSYFIFTLNIDFWLNTLFVHVNSKFPDLLL